ncbi:DUF2711 domain-containing protein [Halobacillus litoralis]|uniref:DUF2711 family protein n=1 Tax=Halobacillus litoralis TaxID=45668 RepID=UPI001CD6931E|nr:DUF2711 family protein [Halobacillus litoralis]MCA0970644.1 DUF2711 domain-containing protein [Halobacillus litoralis]
MCAEGDVPIKTFYEGIFREVFIFFHPFIKPVSIDPELFYPDTYPDKFQIIEHCERVKWSEFLSLSGINSYEELDVALRTSILGLKKEFADQRLADKMKETYERYNLAPPAEGLLPDLLVNKVLEAVRSQGEDWIWVGDEFGTVRKLEYILDLLDEDTLLGKNFFTHDHSMLITTHWDSHFSMICANDRNRIEQMVNECDLEGFFCNDETKLYWSVHALHDR